MVTRVYTAEQKERHDNYMKVYKKERREWLKERGICTECGQERAFDGRTMCPDCLDKIKETSEKTRSEASKEQRKKYIAEKRKRCIEQGICRECLKRKATVGRKCLECHVKSANRNKSRLKGRADWMSIGKCYFCGEDQKEGFKVCKRCYERVTTTLVYKDRDNSNHIWRQIQSGEVKRIQDRKERMKSEKEALTSDELFRQYEIERTIS